MEIKYSGKDLFKSGVYPPEPKIDTIKLMQEVRLLTKAYGLETLEVRKP